MYFQNPPTNFIDKFVLIINPLQMNVNFFLGHQCKILRLTSKDVCMVIALLWMEVGMGRTGDARFCVSTV